MKKLFLLIAFLLINFANLSAEVYHIDIKGTIDLGLPPYIQRAVEEATEQNADAILLEINTFGGRLDAATQIKDILFDSKVKTIAFVNKRAISAGALISLSCDKIVMNTGSTIGAATVVVGVSGEKASEKAISYFRSEMGATAEDKGRNRLIAEGMVDEDIEVPTLSEKGKLITLTAEDAIKWGMADFIAESVDAALDSVGIEDKTLSPVTINWAEKLVRFFTDPMISSLLISLGMIGLFFEIKSPGWGVPGTAGLIMLALFFGSHYIVNLANIIEILLFIVGLVLILLEIFVIPGFGVAGFGGIVAMIAALYLSLLGNFDQLSNQDFVSAAAYLSGSLVAIVTGMVIIFKFFPQTSIWRKISLGDEQKKEEGFRASRNYDDYLGKIGIAISPLRPAGVGLFEKERLDVVSNGAFIEKDTKIVITHIDGYRLVVGPVESEEEDSE